MSYNGPRNPQNPPPSGEAAIIIYNYVPSLALPVVALIAFAIIAVISAVFMIRYKRGRLVQGLLVLGALCEIVGYGSRLYSHYRPFLVIAFVIQYFFIVIAPLAFMSAMYLSTSLIVGRFDLELPKRVSRKGLVAFFVVSDTITIICQIAGAALIGVSESAISDTPPRKPPLQPKQANDILLAGLAAQVASFAVFFAILSLLLAKSRGRAKQVVVLVIWTSVMLWLRTTFRLAETIEGIFGPASSNEALFGTLEFMPIVLGLAPWMVCPLGNCLADDPSPLLKA